MKETKIYCDHCGKELNEMIDYTDLEIDSIVSFIKGDLCKDCVELFNKTVKDFLNMGDNYGK